MGAVSCALALLGGAIGAGFASGREIIRFFAAHGPMAGIAVLSALAALCTLFWRLPVQLERTGTTTLAALCRVRFGKRLGRMCASLFALLCAVTGGAMLAACAELAALTLPLRHAYALGFAVSLPAAAALVGGALGVKPVLSVLDGEIKLCDTARGRPGAYVALFKRIEKMGGVDPRYGYTLLYSDEKGVLAPIHHYMHENLHLTGGRVARLGAVIGTHVGPGCAAVVFVAKDAE